MRDKKISNEVAIKNR